MKKIALLALLLSAVNAKAQPTYPGEGDVLNYRLAGFTAAKQANAAKYLFEVAEYTTNNKGKDIPVNVLQQMSDSNRAILMLPAFDRGYIWRVNYLDAKEKIIGTTPYIHFRTGKYPTIDTGKYRLAILDSATHHDDLFIIMDFSSVIYDLKGNAVWYLPDVPLIPEKNLEMRCIQPTRDGTFTATCNLDAFELSYNGQLLWQAPNDGKVNGTNKENYHHEVVKLSNGNYMMAGFGFSMEKVPEHQNKWSAVPDSGKLEKRADGYYRRIKTDNIIEYNKNKDVVWQWRALDHFSHDEFFQKRAHGSNIDMHMNAFFFDEPNQVLYISFRNTDEILKVAYPSGKILKRFGAVWINDSTMSEDRLFHGQHCITRENDGKILLFNNNTNRDFPKRSVATPVSHIAVFRETNDKNGLAPVWDFPCDIDTNASTYCATGGSVTRLDDGCILANMGSAGRIFIVTPDKKIAWNAIAYTGDGNNTWHLLGQYRVNFITRKQLEKFVFAGMPQR